MIEARAKGAATEVETAEAIVVETVDAADGAAGSDGDAEEEVAEETGAIKVDGTCRPRSTLHRRGSGIRARMTTGDQGAIVPRVLRHRARRVKTTLCCRANLWRNIARGRSRRRLSR